MQLKDSENSGVGELWTLMTRVQVPILTFTSYEKKENLFIYLEPQFLETHGNKNLHTIYMCKYFSKYIKEYF